MVLPLLDRNSTSTESSRTSALPVQDPTSASLLPLVPKVRTVPTPVPLRRPSDVGVGGLCPTATHTFERGPFGISDETDIRTTLVLFSFLGWWMMWVRVPSVDVFCPGQNVSP